MNNQSQLAMREDDGQGGCATAPQGHVSAGHSYPTINISGSAPVHLGDLHYHLNPNDEVQRIASSLHFPEIHRRFESIEDAHIKTFEWIFEPPAELQPPWSSFIDWLKNDDRVYWVSGKPGSGKSTLMKFLFERMLTSRHEEQQKPVVLSFWFWEPGCELERSLVGCVRSLLWQLLRDDRTRSTALQTTRLCADAMWTKRRLLDCFYATLRKLAGMQILLFLDGLDEAGTNAEALLEMVETLNRDIPALKICVSSRPEQTFVDTYSKCPKLRLQDLNAKDIELVMNEDFFDNPKVAQNLKGVDQDQLTDLKLSIRVKAEGVFLWVKLVVRSLLQGLRNRDDIEILQRRLETLPGDLDDLYSFMLQRQNADGQYYSEQASLYFRLIFQYPMNLVEFCLAINDDLRTHYLNPITGWNMSNVETELKCEQAIAWINARSGGLLETRQYHNQIPTSSEPCYEHLGQVLSTYGVYRVQFVHRTARTYITDSCAGRKLLSQRPEASIELERVYFESSLVYKGVLLNLVRSNVRFEDLRPPFIYSNSKYHVRRWTEDYERVYDGLLAKGRCFVDPFFWPGTKFSMLRQSSIPSSDSKTIDYIRVYCLLDFWEQSLEKLDEFESVLSLENLSILLVFVAYAVYRSQKWHFRSPKELSKFFLRLIDLGGNPNHEVTNPNGEKVCLFPYIINWMDDSTPPDVLVPLLRTITDSPSESWPTLSSCNEVFWYHRPISCRYSVSLWGNFCYNDVADILHNRNILAKIRKNASPSRICVICDYPYGDLGLKLYAVRAARSEELLAWLKQLKVLREEQIAYSSIKQDVVGILSISDWPVARRVSGTQFVRDLRHRTDPLTSLMDAMIYMGKAQDVILKWASLEEIKLRQQRKSENDIQRWKSWVFGTNTTARESHSSGYTFAGSSQHTAPAGTPRSCNPSERPDLSVDGRNLDRQTSNRELDSHANADRSNVRRLPRVVDIPQPDDLTAFGSTEPQCNMAPKDRDSPERHVEKRRTSARLAARVKKRKRT